MKLSYKPKGVCSRKMDIEIENGIIESVSIQGGCDGNLKGISSLVRGMSAQDAISRMSGIKCGGKNTSCPDQLAKALAAAMQNGEND